MSEWKKVKLGKVCEFTSDLYSNKEAWQFVNYLDTGNITQNKIESIQLLDLNFTELPSRAKRKIYQNTIVYSTVRPIQRHYGYISNPLENMLVSTGFCVITQSKNVFLKYIYYYLTQNAIVENLQMIAEHTTSTYPAIKSSDIQSLEIYLPPFEEQKAIADILSSLDDKIELNNKINKNLEEQAQALFKRWFVDFEFPNENGDPYKSSGGEMKDSELGSIPKDWDIINFAKLCKTIIGGDWGKEKEEGSFTEKVIIIRGADIPEVSNGGKGKCPIRFINKKNLENKKLSQWQIIVEISGGSPTQSTGRSALITNDYIENCGLPLICTNFCRSIELFNEDIAPLFYLSFKNKYNENNFFLMKMAQLELKI